MPKEEIRVGIIDDDSAKITQMITMIRLCCNDDDGQPLKEKYANYALIPVELTLSATEGDMVDMVISERLDAVIIDYKLSSQKSIAYSGVSLAKELTLRLYNFPVFVLTTYQDDLFDHELFDSYQVFDFERYIADDAERIELNSKLIEQVKKYRAERENWANELATLLPQAGTNATIDARILELDSLLERSINGKAALSLPVKQSFAADKINELIAKIDLLIQEEE